MRRHHLIEEAKTELDLAYEEVKRAEHKIMRFEQVYNDRINDVTGHNGADADAVIETLTKEKGDVQAQIRIDELYRLQGVAVERFAMVSSAFAIVGSIDEVGMSVDLVRKLLFRTEEIRQRKIEIDRSVRQFSISLKSYSREDSSHENDRLVRESWSHIEDILRSFGRSI
ncbi:MAG: hypothetical protein IIA01_08640 [Proteobacteria bacterium]|nr:hypothetical protein [Pseudomonadota bacterium]